MFYVERKKRLVTNYVTEVFTNRKAKGKKMERKLLTISPFDANQCDKLQHTARKLIMLKS